MSPERWQRIDQLFQAAADLPTENRSAFLDAQNIEDPELRASVEGMLASLTQDLIRPAIADALDSFQPPADPSLSGKQLGPYQLQNCIGKGGMGAVYRAFRTSAEFEQQVAVKVLHPEIARGRLADRFYAERRILSSLEHPYIARLIDGGTQDGVPYLVMEYAAGIPLDRYCQENNLDIRQRLDLFRKICQAVQHAHQRLIVHSDLKPSNILVLADGTPKLLDFGIAKLLDPEQRGEITLTETGWRPMTPEYASPEQIKGETITVATDVYSLGVILYQLLTGERPYRFSSRSPVELHQVICTGPVPVPSTLVKQDTRVRRLLLGDLDNVVLMALRKEPERRYQSVEQFSEDIRRHLIGQTVIARPDTFAYRTQKFVRRNRISVVLALALLLTGAAGVFFTVREGRRAQNRFAQVRTLASRILTDFDAEARKLNNAEKLRQVMVDQSLLYLDSLSSEASSDPTLQQELAQAYHRIGDIQGYHRIPNLGHRDLALSNHIKALAIEEQLFRQQANNLTLRRSLASGYVRLSELQRNQGQSDNSEKSLQRAIALTSPDDPESFVPTRIQLSRNHSFRGELPEALQYLNEALPAARLLPDPAFLLVIYNEQSEAMQRLGKPDEALRLNAEAWKIVEANRSKFKDAGFARREAALLVEQATALGMTRWPSLGRFCEAVPIYQKGLDIIKLSSSNHPFTTGVALQLLEARSACGLPLPPDLVQQTRAWVGSHKDGQYYLESTLALDDLRHHRPKDARRRLAPFLQNGVSDTDVFEALAEIEIAEGALDKAFVALKKARALRAPALNRRSYDIYELRYAQGKNLHRALSLGDPDPTLPAELRQLVSTWPKHRLPPAYEEIRAAAK